jgi:hypothetical protein
MNTKREYDKRMPHEEAVSLVARRIDHSDLRFRKDMFGLDESARLSSHFEVVHIATTEEPMHDGGRAYLVHRWGVKVNGVPAGYISTSREGTRHRLLPYSYRPDCEVAG